jgi:hypothetical protein
VFEGAEKEDQVLEVRSSSPSRFLRGWPRTDLVPSLAALPWHMPLVRRQQLTLLCVTAAARTLVAKVSACRSMCPFQPWRSCFHSSSRRRTLWRVMGAFFLSASSFHVLSGLCFILSNEPSMRLCCCLSVFAAVICQIHRGHLNLNTGDTARWKSLHLLERPMALLTVP